MKSEPKVIFFDWNKTLSNSLFWSHMSPDKQHKYSEYHGKLITSLFVENKHLINPWMRGEHTTQEVMQMLSPLVGLPAEILEEELAVSCRNQAFVDESIPELINALKAKGIKVVIATDNMDTFRKHTVPSMDLELLFDDLLISCELGLLKGDHDEKSIPFFDEYLEKYNWKYSDSVLLDDCIDKTGVYDNLGLQIRQITSPEVFVEILKEYAD